MKKMQQFIEKYIKSCKTSGLAATTQENYRRALCLFAGSAPENLVEITTENISEWKEQLFDSGAKQSTIRVYLRAVSLFFAWAQENGYIEANPCTATVAKTKVPPAAPYEHILGQDAVRDMLSPNRPNGASRATFPRNHAMAVLLVTSGMRNSELRNLTPADLDSKHGRLIIRSGKGNKTRYAAYVPAAQAAIKAYFDSGMRPEGLKETDLLFGHGENAEQWHEINRTELTGLMKRFTALYANGEGVGTHALRHSSASFMWDKGMSVDEIQELLGHNDTKTTQIYLERLRPDVPVNHAASIFTA